LWDKIEFLSFFIFKNKKKWTPRNKRRTRSQKQQGAINTMKYAAKKKCVVIVAQMNMTKNVIRNPWKNISLTAKPHFCTFEKSAAKPHF